MAIGFGVHASEGVLAAPARRVGGDAVSARRVYPGLETTGVSFFYTRAYKHTDAGMLASNRQTVIADYRVNYGAGTAGTTLSNTHDWEYVGVQPNQTIKYWDFSATKYRFFGYVSEDDRTAAVTPTPTASADEQVTVTYSDIDLRYLTTPLYSRLLLVERASFGQAVQLEFAYAVAMVEVKFYLGANPQGWSHLTNIRFTPADASAIPTRASSIQINYPIAGTTPEKTTEALAVTSSTGASMAALTYRDLTIPYADWQTGLFAVPSESNCVIAGTTTRYAVLPAPTNPAFVMSLDLEGKHKTATVPAQYMQWKPNTHYTYVFKLTADLEIVLEDVLVDSWSVVDKKSTETTW